MGGQVKGEREKKKKKTNGKGQKVWVNQHPKKKR